jgi:hypothetical protein
MLLSTFIFFVISELRQKVIIHFLDIGGIVDHHCWNFLFIQHCIFVKEKLINLYINIFILQHHVLFYNKLHKDLTVKYLSVPCKVYLLNLSWKNPNLSNITFYKERKFNTKCTMNEMKCQFSIDGTFLA